MAATSVQINRVGKGLAGLSVASLIRLFRFGPRDALQRVNASFRAVDPFGRDEFIARIPTVPFSDLSAFETRIVMDRAPSSGVGSVSPFELLCLVTLAREANPKGVLEVGTYDGSTTLNLALNLPDAVVHTLDLPLDFASDTSAGALPVDDRHLIGARKVGSRFLGRPESSRIRQHLGDSAVYDLGVIQEPLSFFFIDGSHTYEYARSDTLRCLAAARGADATVLWHDCHDGHPGVTRWLVGMIDAGLGVKRIADTSLGYLRVDPSAPDVRRRLDRLAQATHGASR